MQSKILAITCLLNAAAFGAMIKRQDHYDAPSTWSYSEETPSYTDYPSEYSTTTEYSVEYTTDYHTDYSTPYPVETPWPETSYPAEPEPTTTYPVESYPAEPEPTTSYAPAPPVVETTEVYTPEPTTEPQPAPTYAPNATYSGPSPPEFTGGAAKVVGAGIAAFVGAACFLFA